jgi:hypothetical protein
MGGLSDFVLRTMLEIAFLVGLTFVLAQAVPGPTLENCAILMFLALVVGMVLRAWRRRSDENE